MLRLFIPHFVVRSDRHERTFWSAKNCLEDGKMLSGISQLPTE